MADCSAQQVQDLETASDYGDHNKPPKSGSRVNLLDLADDGGEGKKKKSKETHNNGGGEAFTMDDIPEDASWGEVFHTCCCHTPGEWGMIAIGISIVLFFLYFFLFGLDLLGSGAKVMGGCAAGELFGDDTNPVAGVMVGILATVFLQSSSTTTSIVVSLVGAGSVSVNQGIYMIMGANIGTSGTCSLCSVLCSTETRCIYIYHISNSDSIQFCSISHTSPPSSPFFSFLSFFLSFLSFFSPRLQMKNDTIRHRTNARTVQ